MVNLALTSLMKEKQLRLNESYKSHFLPFKNPTKPFFNSLGGLKGSFRKLNDLGHWKLIDVFILNLKLEGILSLYPRGAFYSLVEERCVTLSLLNLEFIIKNYIKQHQLEKLKP